MPRLQPTPLGPQTNVRLRPETMAATDRQLRRIVTFNVRADPALIDDACQTAWLRLTRSRLSLAPAPRLAWLVTTATREALRLVRRARAELSLDTPEVLQLASPAPGPERLAEQRSQLAGIGELGERQRRLIWLQGLGLSYREMADREGATVRTIERQMRRARDRLRAAEAPSEMSPDMPGALPLAQPARRA